MLAFQVSIVIARLAPPLRLDDGLCGGLRSAERESEIGSVQRRTLNAISLRMEGTSSSSFTSSDVEQAKESSASISVPAERSQAMCIDVCGEAKTRVSGTQWNRERRIFFATSDTAG